MNKWIGEKLTGFCNGFFGRDEYGDKIIEAIGSDWLVVRNEDGAPMLASFKSRQLLDEMLLSWSKGDPYYENDYE